MHTSRLGYLLQVYVLCLGLGASALDRIKRPNRMQYNFELKQRSKYCETSGTFVLDRRYQVKILSLKKKKSSK
jgi:hypothetical protein